MVICGGLEILAAGYLLNEFNKDKIETRERRKRRDTGDGRPHNHSQPPPVGGRPHHRPQNVEQPPQSRPNFLQPPPQAPPRPISAPPIDPRPGGGWQQNNQPQGPYGPQQMHPQQPPSNPYLQALHNDQFQQHPAPWQQPMMGAMQPQSRPQFNNPPPPGPSGLQHANSFHPGQPQPQPHPPFQQGPPPPGPGHLQRPNTFQAPQHISQPNLPTSNTFPIQSSQQAMTKPPPPGPLFYVDTKTGRISHNMYPPDHPMARGPNGSISSADLSKELWGDENYKKTMAGDINTGMRWSERDEDDLAYGKDYSDGRRGSRRRSTSYERTRRRTDSEPYRY